MKTYKIGLSMAILFLYSFFAVGAFAAGLANDSVLSQHVKEADGTTGQDTNIGSGIKTGHIQNGAITAAKLGFYKNVIIVAPSGGDFTDPVAALNAITDASATNPYLVKIMPGIYNIGAASIQMKQYVDIEGSGENTTKVTGIAYSNSAPALVGVIAGASNSEIRFLTVENRHQAGYWAAGIVNDNVSPKITNVTVIVSVEGDGYGIINRNLAAPQLNNVSVNVSSYSDSLGIMNDNSIVSLTNVAVSVHAAFGNYAYFNYNQGTTAMKNVKLNASGGSFNPGIYYESGIVKVDHSEIAGSPAITKEAGTSITMYIGYSKLEGSMPANLKCIGVYDNDYNPLTCP